GRGRREGTRQVRRDDARDQERQPEKAEAVQDEERSQRLRALSKAECRPDVVGRDHPPRDRAECDAPKECELRQHARLLSPSIGTNWYRIDLSVVPFGTDVKSKRNQ